MKEEDFKKLLDAHNWDEDAQAPSKTWRRIESATNNHPYLKTTLWNYVTAKLRQKRKDLNSRAR